MPLFGNLHGAVFLDAGNVWNLHDGLVFTEDELNKAEDIEEYNYMVQFNKWADQAYFKFSEFFNDIALGTGIGLRYDLGFLVVRVDWGIALHCPYDTGTSGYFNINRFKDAQTLNFAIGYPF